MSKRLISVDLDRVKEIYYTQTKVVPTSLTDVCDAMKLDYFDLITYLREKSRKAGKMVLEPHVLPPRFGQQKRTCVAEILFDYRMLTSYSYDLIAVVFGYDNKSNVHRTVRKARYFGMAEPKRLFPETLVLEWHPNQVSRFVEFSVFSLNKAIHDLAKDPMHISASGLKKVAITRKIDVYKPIYELIVNTCQRTGMDMDDFISSAVIRFCL